jgi:hypothetical protein
MVVIFFMMRCQDEGFPIYWYICWCCSELVSRINYALVCIGMKERRQSLNIWSSVLRISVLSSMSKESMLEHLETSPCDFSRKTAFVHQYLSRY